MALEILAGALCIVALTVVIGMLLLALAGLVEPVAIVRCHVCAQWMMNAGHVPGAVCFRCAHRHAHAPIT